MSPRMDHGESSYKCSGRLKGRSAPVTGEDSGIGRAVAKPTLAFSSVASCQVRFTIASRSRIVLDPAPDFWLNHFGEPTGPFRILMTEQHFAWLNVQCKEMR
jgi:hypothetical protein